MSTALARAMGYRGERLRDLARALPRAEALLAGPQQKLDHVSHRLPAALMAGIQTRRSQFARPAALLRPQLLSERIERAALLDRLAALPDCQGKE